MNYFDTCHTHISFISFIVSSVYSFVRENLKVKEAKFYLYQPPQQKFSEFDTLSLYQLQLSPASVLYLMPESEGARLSDEALRLLEELPLHQTLISSDVTTTSGPTSGPTDTPSGPSTVTASSSSGPSNRPTSSNATKQNGMPKWFKGFKK